MALSEFILHLSKTLKYVERRLILSFFGRPPPPLDFGVAVNVETRETVNIPFSLKELIGDGFLFAVPKHRRTIEKRLNRKFGYPEYVWKPLVPKTNLRVCFDCGNHHEVGVLCAHCYEKVRAETQAMQDKIKENIGLNAIENEVVVLYDGEKMEQPDEFWKGKRIIEMEKPRPPWFSKNLLQKSTQQPSTSTDVKPSELA